MNKAELVAAVAEKTALSKKDSEKAVNAAFEVISAELAAGGKVQLVGFGSFETKERNARVGRNATRASAATPEPRKRSRFLPAASPLSRPARL